MMKYSYGSDWVSARSACREAQLNNEALQFRSPEDLWREPRIRIREAAQMCVRYALSVFAPFRNATPRAPRCGRVVRGGEGERLKEPETPFVGKASCSSSGLPRGWHEPTPALPKEHRDSPTG